MATVDVSTISARAYSIWEQEGRPDGRALNHWVQAEAEAKSAVAENTPARDRPLGVATVKIVAAQMAQPVKREAVKSAHFEKT